MRYYKRLALVLGVLNALLVPLLYAWAADERWLYHLECCSSLPANRAACPFASFERSLAPPGVL